MTLENFQCDRSVSLSPSRLVIDTFVSERGYVFGESENRASFAVNYTVC